MTGIELVATICGLACVWLTIRQNIWCWPAGLVQVVLYVWVFYHARLYSDMVLHVIYIGLGIYGWYHWLRGGLRESALPIARLHRSESMAWLAIAAVATLAVGFAMHRWTNAALPYWDASIMVLSLIAQYLLARKVLENWLIWITVDVLAIGVYAVKALYITTGLYAVFLGMAVMGWFAWQRSFRTANTTAATASSSASSCPLTAATSS